MCNEAAKGFTTKLQEMESLLFKRSKSKSTAGLALASAPNEGN